MSQRSVIAIEGDIEVGRTVFAACQKFGLDVRVFEDALDALMEAAKSMPDLIIFDADTPVLGSLDFADVMLRDPQFKAVVLLAIVGETDAVARRQYSSRGIAVAARRNDAGKMLGRELSRLLKPFAAYGSPTGRSSHRGGRKKGAA